MRLGPIVLVAAILASSPAWADGTVFRAAGCGDKMFVSSTTGFSILTGIGGTGVKDQDALVGKVDTIGHTELYDRTGGFNFSANVEDRRLSREDIVPRIAVICRAPLQNGMASGTVMRSEGCRDRIFVLAPQGMAVLQRLAGGVVGKDDELTGDFNKPGRATVKDKQTGAMLTVFVEDFQLSRAAADRKITALCTATR